MNEKKSKKKEPKKEIGFRRCDDDGRCWLEIVRTAQHKAKHSLVTFKRCKISFLHAKKQKPNQNPANTLQKERTEKKRNNKYLYLVHKSLSAQMERETLSMCRTMMLTSLESKQLTGNN